MYRRNGKNVADFIDYGKKIVLSAKFDEESVLAALQLASQKWGEVQLSGSEKYKQLCVRLAAKRNFKIANPELRAAVEEERRKNLGEVKPQIGQRVTFHVHNSDTKLTGEVVSIDKSKGTVTLRTGSMNIPVYVSKGYFVEAAPLDRTHTKEYACELAKKHVGKNDFVFLARSDGTYQGPIVGTTPTFALQKTGPDMITLHRLKDLEGFDEKRVSEGREAVIRKAAGKGIVHVEPQREEQGKNKGWSR
jgi:hypothetical protein